MQPFLVPSSFERLVETYPTADDLKAAIGQMRPAQVAWVARLWISEGIPYAFSRAPVLYEIIRDWLAVRLGVCPKEITVVGSARIGYSLTPSVYYGRVFSPTSDLDLTVISQSLFTRLGTAFEKWSADVSTGNVFPKTEKDKRYWDDNLARLPGNIDRGFVDEFRIPAPYHTVRHVMEHLVIKMIATPQAPKVRRASVRAYRDWDAFFRQQGLNLSQLGKRLWC